MNIREMRKKLGDTQSEFAMRYNIPFRTIQNWETGVRKPPEYVIGLLEQRVRKDLINRRTFELPKHDPKKTDLPKRSDFLGTIAWLKAVKERIGEPIVFALDEALMCQGYFLGRDDEYLVWVYGNDDVTRFNGVVVLGNRIDSDCIDSRNGLDFTNFNRTVTDALDNENILDMQGITEALNRYYVSHGDSFDGIFVAPEHRKRFKELLMTSKGYYGD